MSIQRGVRKAPEGKAGYEVEGLPDHTYDEASAKRLQYLRTDGSNEFDFPEDGVLEELDDNHDVDATPPALSNPSGRP